MRIQSDLLQDDFQELKKESKEILGLDGELYPPFGAHQDYVEYQIFDINDNFKERKKSVNYTLEDDKIVLNIGQDLRDAGYNRGSYKVKYYFVRPKAGDSDEIILTKTIDGVSGIVHSGNPELTGVPMGDFYIDDDGQAFTGTSAPIDGDPQPLDIKEYKYKIEAISGDRTEVRIIPQIINNEKYNNDFRKLVSDTNTYRSTKTTQPSNAQIQAAIEEAILNGQDPQDVLANLEGDTGGEISFTGPDSSRIEFNSRIDSVDPGFTQNMRRGKLIVKDAYVIDYTSQPDVKENSSFNIEDPIPELYIQVVKQQGSRVVDYQLYTKDGNIFNPNTNGVQFYWEFGCGHDQETSTSSNASHEYDVDGNFTPTVYVFTPNFSEEVNEIRTSTGRTLLQVDSSPSELPPEATENTEAEEEFIEVPPPMESAYDGYIIKWNGIEQPAPFFSSGPSRATTGTRWWVQNGHTRAIQGGDDGAIIPLRQLTGITSNDDVSVPLEHINDLRIGPNLDFSNFGNPNENEIRKEIKIDWRDPGNPDDFLTNRNAREVQAAIPTTVSVVVNAIFTFQGDVQALSVPDDFSIADISSNVNPESTLNLTGPDAILLNFEIGQEVVLTISPNGPFSSPFNTATINGGGTVNDDINVRTISFTADTDKTIEVVYGAPIQ
tara:strand:- start:2698 stop:4683 length:1986 start_codon:yes stop_codon:yes gene_type:complete